MLTRVNKAVRVITPEYILLGVVVAFLWVNFHEESYHYFVDHTLATLPWMNDTKVNLHFISNEVFMALFFLVAGKEVFESMLPGGALHGLKKASMPIVATLGGVIGPAVLYLTLAHTLMPEVVNGWVVPTATDIAFALLVAKFIFGFNHPAVTFITTIAVVDDGIGLVLIAGVYAEGVNWLLLTTAVVSAIAVVYVMRAVGIKKWQVYFICVGIPLWIAFNLLGVEPAMALIPLVFAMPHAQNDLGMWNPKELERHDTLNEMEHAISPWLGVILIVFGFCNGGIGIGGVGTLTSIVLLALVAGKFVGIVTFSYIGARLGLSLPSGMKFSDIPIVGAIAGIGFTVAIFVAGVAFTGEMAEHAKMGAALSLVAAASVAFLLGLSKRRLKTD